MPLFPYRAKRYGEAYSPAVDAQGRADCQVGQYGYMNGPLNGPDAKYPPALYWGIRLGDIRKGAWKIDLWALEPPDCREALENCERIAARLTAESRRVILALKAQLWQHPSYRDTITSKTIYDAVLGHDFSPTPAEHEPSMCYDATYSANVSELKLAASRQRTSVHNRSCHKLPRKSADTEAAPFQRLPAQKVMPWRPSRDRYSIQILFWPRLVKVGALASAARIGSCSHREILRMRSSTSRKAR